MIGTGIFMGVPADAPVSTFQMRTVLSRLAVTACLPVEREHYASQLRAAGFVDVTISAGQPYPREASSSTPIAEKLATEDPGPLQLYLCISIAAHMAPSPRDLAGGFWGGVVALGLGCFAVGLLGSLGFSTAFLLVVLSVLTVLAALAVVFHGLYAFTVFLLVRP